MNRLLKLRSEHKRLPLSSYVIRHEPVFANMKVHMRNRKYMIPLVYYYPLSNVNYAASMYTRSNFKCPLRWFYDEPKELKFISEYLSRCATPMSEMIRYNSTRIIHN